MNVIIAAVIACLAQDPKAPKDENAELSKDLEGVWTKIVEHAQAGNKDEVQKAIAAMELTRDEMTKLFGEEKAGKAHEPYAETWKKSVLTEAADDLIKRSKSWYEIEVWCTNTREDKDLSGVDRGVLSSLADREKTRVFNIRLKEKGAKDGFVLRTFVKTEAGWKMGLTIGKLLAK
jgi:hypothetical protein